MGFLCIAGMEKRKSCEKSICHLSKLLYNFPFLQESNGDEHNPIFPIKTKASEITVSVETELLETLIGPG